MKDQWFYCSRIYSISSPPCPWSCFYSTVSAISVSFLAVMLHQDKVEMFGWPNPLWRRGLSVPVTLATVQLGAVASCSANWFKVRGQMKSNSESLTNQPQQKSVTLPTAGKSRLFEEVSCRRLAHSQPYSRWKQETDSGLFYVLLHNRHPWGCLLWFFF